MFKNSSSLSLSAKVFLILVGSLIIAFKTLPDADLFGLAFILLGISFLFLPVKENRLVWLLGWFFLAAAVLCLGVFISSRFTR